jgi:GTP pyrophosphokinase
MAYTLSADLGHSCIAARRGNRLVPLSMELTDGDVVEIVANPQEIHRRPSKDWLAFVKSPAARLHIERYFESHPEDPEKMPEQPAGSLLHRVALGRGAIARSLRRHKRSLLDDAPLHTLANRLGLPDAESLAAEVADGRREADEVADALVDLIDRMPTLAETQAFLMRYGPLLQDD